MQSISCSIVPCSRTIIICEAIVISPATFPPFACIATYSFTNSASFIFTRIGQVRSGIHSPYSKTWYVMFTETACNRNQLFQINTHSCTKCSHSCHTCTYSLISLQVLSRQHSAGLHKLTHCSSQKESPGEAIKLMLQDACRLTCGFGY